jgi:hypothetical protein
MLTPRESVEAVLRGGIADRIPFTIYENKLHRCAVERVLRNRGMCVVRRDIPVFNTIMPNVKIDSHEYNDQKKKLFRTDYQTPYGTLYIIEERNSYTSWTHERLFKGPKDYKPLLYMIEDMNFEPNFQEFHSAQESDGCDSFFRGSIGSEPMQELISRYMGTERFCMEWFDHQDEVLKLYAALAEKRRQVYPICADSPALAFNYGGNVTPEILGLKRFEEYYVPHYNEAAEILHEKGKFIGVHFDANCKLIAEAIAKTKLDYIEAFTPSPDTDMTLTDARKVWQDKILWINFPSSVHLESIEVIQEVTKDLLVQMGSAEKFIMGITEDIPENRWQQNLMAISDVLIEREAGYM